jgi:hypothetical protein
MDEKTPNRSGFTRRDVFKASAGAAAVLAAAGAPIIATAGPALADNNSTQGEGNNDSKLRVEPLIPQKNRGMILYSVRDRISAAPDNTGVPYGFAQVLEAVAKCGYSEVEFAGYTRVDPGPPDHPGRDPRTPRRQRPGRERHPHHHQPCHVRAGDGHRPDARHEEHRHRR